MIAGIKEASEVFERRFFFNALLPTTIALLSIAVSVLACLGRLGAALHSIASMPVPLQLAAIGAGLSVIWMTAAVLSSQWRGLTRLYEGYPLLHFWRALALPEAWLPGIKHHAARQAYANVHDPDRLYRYYAMPEPDGQRNVLPTKLGNILLSAERYPYHRYSIDPVYFWPRLYPLLPTDFQVEYGKYVDAYQFQVVLSFLSSLVTSVICAILFATQQHWSLFVLVSFAGMTSATGFYEAACAAALSYGEQMRTAFDVYRSELELLFPGLDSINDEREKYRSMTALILFGDARLADYVDGGQ